MIGAIAGDIIGSVYEFNNFRREDFNLFSPDSNFTDDTVMTIAIAAAIVNGKSYEETMREYGEKYPDVSYGIMFNNWLKSRITQPYNSFGNGSAMRVSPIGFAFNTEDYVLREAQKSAEVTHNHPEGIKGAQATAIAVFLATKGETKAGIKKTIESRFGYNLNHDLPNLRCTYRFNETCQGTVPQAITVFLKSENYEDATRKAVSIGGDSDTIACIVGGIAQAYYKSIPDYIAANVRKLLPAEFLTVIDLFNERYGGNHDKK